MSAFGTAVERSSADLPSEPALSLPALLIALAAGVSLFDGCFWRVSAWGFSVAVFFVLMTVVVLWLRRNNVLTRSLGMSLVLLAGAATAATLETSWVNTVVFFVLFVVISGDSYFGNRSSVWDRGLCQVSAIIRAPGRIFWLAARLLEVGSKNGGGVSVGLLGLFARALPALFLMRAAVFATGINPKSKMALGP